MAKSYEEGSIIKDAAEGATKGVLNWTKEQVSELIERLKNKDLGFIGNKETIDIVKEQLKAGEWNISKKFIDDKELRLLFQMGLTLRKLESKGEAEQTQDLRDKIVQRFGTRGLHIAQFVQSGICGRYLGAIMSKISSVEDIKSNLNEILQNIDRYVAFIKQEHEPKRQAERIKTVIDAHNPSTFIIFSKSSANRISKRIIGILKKEIPEYCIEQISEKEDNIYFLNRNEGI